MIYTEPLDPTTHHLQPLLDTMNTSVDWLNTDNDDPHGIHSVARSMLVAVGQLVPPRFAAATPDHPRVLSWIGQVAEAAEQRRASRGREIAAAHTGPSLMLLGPTGTGKTWQSFGAMRGLAVTGTSGIWKATTSADLYAALRPRHGVDSEAEFRSYRDARLLLLDDLGAERTPTEFVEEINYRLINHRYERKLPTIITSNAGAKELAQRLGDRVASRLREMCTVAVLDGVDRRRNGGTK